MTIDNAVLDIVDPTTTPVTFLRTLMARRSTRYAAISAFAFGLSQAGLVIAYGLFRWSGNASVAFALAVSVVPSYLASRWYVWPDREGGSRRRELAGFVGLAILGSVVTALFVDALSAGGKAWGLGHGGLTVLVDLGSLLANAAVWAGRYVVLDRVLFASPDVP